MGGVYRGCKRAWLPNTGEDRANIAPAEVTRRMTSDACKSWLRFSIAAASWQELLHLLQLLGENSQRRRSL